MTDNGFILHWNRIRPRREFEQFGRLYLLPGVRLQVRLSRARPSFYLLKKNVDSKNVFKFLDAQLLVRCVTPNLDILLAHTVTLKAG